MPKRPPQPSAPRATLALAAIALALFLGGEAFLLSRTDAGRIAAARYLHLGDPAKVTRMIGSQLHRALEAAEVSRDSVSESVVEGGPAPLRWRVGLGPGISALQANYSVSRFLAEEGAVVLSGRERPGDQGETVVTLLLGLPGRPTHELRLVQHPRGRVQAAGGRLAIVVFGFGEDVEQSGRFFDLPAPFAVALVPGGKTAAAQFRAARRRDREVVLHLPLEPINYPRVDPGPGTILVTMGPSKIADLVHRYLEQAGSVAAVANYSGSLATQDMTVMTSVFQELRRRDIPFLHVSAAAGSVCKPLASELGVRYVEPDAILDAEARPSRPQALEAHWKRVLAEARHRGHMLVMVRATPLTLAWLPKALTPARLEGTQIVPLSALLQKSPEM